MFSVHLGGQVWYGAFCPLKKTAPTEVIAMAQESVARPKPTPKPKPIKVTVRFPVSAAGPLHVDRPASETVGAVRDEAMAHFGVANDSQFTYYLTHDGSRIDDARTLGEVAGNERTLKFTMVKELVQG